MKILIDMNLSPRWATELAKEGFEAAHWSAVGEVNAPDARIMAYAAERGAVVLTHDLDFGAILAATGGRKPSVIQLRGDDVRPEASAGAVVAALRQCAVELSSGALLTVDAPRYRLTLLPLRKDA